MSTFDFDKWCVRPTRDGALILECPDCGEWFEEDNQNDPWLEVKDMKEKAMVHWGEAHVT